MTEIRPLASPDQLGTEQLPAGTPLADAPPADTPPADAALTDTAPVETPLADALLAAPPSTVSDEDLAAALSAPPPTARALRLTRVLVTALVLVLGFVAGVLVNQIWGSSSGQVAGPSGDRGSFAEGELPSGFPSGMAFPGGTGAGDGTGQGAPAGSAGTDASTPTSGEVTLVDGDVIYLTLADGTQMRVEVGDDTTIQKATTAELDDIEEGDTVTVTGTTTEDGMTATSVEVSK